MDLLLANRLLHIGRQNHMKTLFRTILPLLCFAMVFAIVGGCGRHSTEQVEARERKSVSSPDGKLEAKLALLELGTGETQLRRQMIYLIPTGMVLKLKGPDTAGYIAASIDSCRDENVDVHWTGNDKIVVQFSQDRPSWVEYVPQVQGVTVVLESAANKPTKP